MREEFLISRRIFKILIGEYISGSTRVRELKTSGRLNCYKEKPVPRVLLCAETDSVEGIVTNKERNVGNRYPDWIHVCPVGDPSQ